VGASLEAADLAAAYRGADVVLAPYRAEGFALSPLEGAASGVPVIVTRGGAADEFTDESFAAYIEADREALKTGSWLVPREGEVLRALERACDDAAWREAAAVAGPAHVAKLAWHVIVQRYVTLARFAHESEGEDMAGDLWRNRPGVFTQEEYDEL
jgi:glycosyltransferase involved in cell wall biosynthesis